MKWPRKTAPQLGHTGERLEASVAPPCPVRMMKMTGSRVGCQEPRPDVAAQGPAVTVSVFVTSGVTSRCAGPVTEEAVK